MSYLGFVDFKFLEGASMAQCPTCNDGEFRCPPVCPFIPPGGTAEQAMAMLADDEPEVFDGDW